MKLGLLKFLMIFMLVLVLLDAKAFSAPLNPVAKAIENTTLSQDSIISVDIKNVSSGHTVFSRRPNIFLNPASALKVFTMAAALDTLGDEYCFETIAYIDNDKNIYLKLGGDPLLTSSDLNVIAQNLKKAYGGKIKNFYIDDFVIDKVSYPDGWTVDDLWPNSPKISPYIVDGNTVDVDFGISNDGKNVIISQNNDYRFSFINELTAGSTTNILPSLNYGEDSGIVSLSGTLSGNITKSFPVLDTAQFFTGKLRKALDNNGISYSRQFYAKRTPVDAKRIASFRRPLREVLCFILKTSDNFAAEVVFKVAAAKWAEKTLNSFETDKAAGEDVKNKSRIATINSSYGTLYNGKLMFFEYYDKAGLDTGKINLKDASGVSRYNALKTSWMVDALIYLDKNSKIREYMITADEGTLKRRMRDLKGNLKAKTGTIFGVSSLVGYVSSMEGVNYAFSIIIQNFGEKSSVVKGLEDDIVHGIYFLE